MVQESTFGGGGHSKGWRLTAINCGVAAMLPTLSALEDAAEIVHRVLPPTLPQLPQPT